MSDKASKAVDKKIKKLQDQLEDVYFQASKDLTAKINDFNDKFMAKDAKYLEMLDKGEITQDQYQGWLKGQVFQSKQWENKKFQIVKTICSSNQVAAKIVSGESINVFADNANWTAYVMETGEGIDFGFGLYDFTTVINLIKNDPKILPEWKINEPKDYIWNEKKVNRAITQGIIQGESLNKIAKRLTNDLVTTNENHMKTFARTAMTGAQNAGRDQRFMEAKAKGILMVKEWMATLDGRTRDSHKAMDGEKIKVSDKFHPMKFSNGCRFPGDPEGPPWEVYNCRCTLVGDIEAYPDEYKRYDNIDGKPIENMTYKEWYKAKYNKDFVYTPKVPKSKAPQIDYSKYGNEEVVKILDKYKDWDDFYLNSDWDEWCLVDNAVYSNHSVTKSYYKDKADGKLKTIEQKKAKAKLKLTDEEKAKIKYENDLKEYEKNLKSAQDTLDALEQEIKDKGADKVFSDIWYGQNVTYADWESKKDSIESKREYYIEKIRKQREDFYKEFVPNPEDVEAGEELYDLLAQHTSKSDAVADRALAELMGKLGIDDDEFGDVWDDFNFYRNRVIKFTDKLSDLAEFEKYGEEYSKLLKEKDAAKSALSKVKSSKPKDPSKVIAGAFGDDAYSKERKDKALWAKTDKAADAALRPVTSEVWKDSSKEERQAAYNYTAGSGSFNRPLRGYKESWNNKVGIGDVPLDQEGSGKDIERLTTMIGKSKLTQDTWLQRGVDTDGLAGFLQIAEDDLRYKSQDELEALLLGKEINDTAFMSCGSKKGAGFSGNILNVYCPEGTEALYVEPFSAFGGSKWDEGGIDWDGDSGQSSFGGELETIIQRNTYYRITKVEKSGYRLYLDLEVVDQRPYEINYN